MGFVAREIKRRTGKAISQQEMIRDGDHVLVAVSGGKDSLVLLRILHERLKRIPISYHLTAVHVDPGFGGNSAKKIESYLLSHGFDYRIIESDIGPRAHGDENRENPCFLCSRMRRKLLFEQADVLGCTRIALGHHKDDIIETLFLNMFYGASISTMLPVQALFSGKLTLIRPLYLLDESLVKRYAEAMDFPKIQMNCPSAGTTKREEIKRMLNGFYRSSGKIKGNIFHALQNVNPEYLL